MYVCMYVCKWNNMMPELTEAMIIRQLIVQSNSVFQFYNDATNAFVSYNTSMK